MEMMKKFKLGILVCLVIILGNMGSRIFLVKDQIDQVAGLQQTLSEIRNPPGFHRILTKETGAVLEKDLEKISTSLDKSKRMIELLQRSVYSTALKLESQFKKSRIEAAQELEKDLERIEYLVKNENDESS